MQCPIFLPDSQVYWYVQRSDITPLTTSLKTDVVIIGGGMAGLTAAQSFAERGLKVVIIEKNFCGSGASGKSSGFITPDSEVPLRTFKELHGDQEARNLWEFILSGVHVIQNNIKKYGFDCDYQEQDTLFVANTASSFVSDVQEEHKTRQELNYPSKLYAQNELPTILGTKGYKGGVTYAGTFGIHAYRYCSNMKKMLQEQGVQIYEETAVSDIKDHQVTTNLGHIIEAESIIVCTDRFARDLPTLKNNLYHVQNLLLLSAPLNEEYMKRIFPERAYMVWDTDIIYQFYRQTGDNRMMLGGGNLLQAYSKNANYNNQCTARKLTRYFKTKFPEIPIYFEYMWPGMIGISKDLFPLAGQDKDMPSVYYVTAATGLPWAAALGMYCVQSILDKKTTLDKYFSPYRSFTLGPIANRLLGTRLTFALSNFFTVGSV
jgi:gamma-glutamylputrescine oxidase